MKRRTFLAAIVGAPLVKALPTPKLRTLPWPGAANLVIPITPLCVLKGRRTGSTVANGYVALPKRREFTHAEIEEARRYANFQIVEVAQ